jgi:hypothetical protein
MRAVMRQRVSPTFGRVQTAKDGKNSGSKTDKAPKQKRTRRFCSYSLHKINENKKEMNRTTKL